MKRIKAKLVLQNDTELHVFAWNGNIEERTKRRKIKVPCNRIAEF